MEITIDLLENYNKEFKTKHTVEEWEKSKFKILNHIFSLKNQKITKI